MNEQTILIIQTDILGQQIYSTNCNISKEVAIKISLAIGEKPELIGAVFHDKESGNFYKAVYSL